MKTICNYLLFALTMFWVQTGLADAAEKVSSVVDKIPAPDGQVVLIGAALLELGMRLFKTKKPVSFIQAATKVIRVVADGLIKVCDLIDAILPERVEGQTLVGKKPKV